MRGASNNVSVRCEGPTAWTLYVPVRVRDLRPVLVLARAVRRGEPIDAGMLRAETRDVAQLPFGYLTELRSVEHTSELQSLMRLSYAVFCLKKKNKSKDY